jgi:hypothetical protein
MPGHLVFRQKCSGCARGVRCDLRAITIVSLVEASVMWSWDGKGKANKSEDSGELHGVYM